MLLLLLLLLTGPYVEQLRW